MIQSQTLLDFKASFHWPGTAERGCLFTQSWHKYHSNVQHRNMSNNNKIGNIPTERFICFFFFKNNLYFSPLSSFYEITVCEKPSQGACSTVNEYTENTCQPSASVSPNAAISMLYGSYTSHPTLQGGSASCPMWTQFSLGTTAATARLSCAVKKAHGSATTEHEKPALAWLISFWKYDLICANP